MDNLDEYTAGSVAQTLLCIARLKAVSRANGAHVDESRRAIRESLLAIHEAGWRYPLPATFGCPEWQVD